MDSSKNQQQQQQQQKDEQGQPQFTTMPVDTNPPTIYSPDDKFSAFKAAPGPAVAQDLPPVEGTKAEREARKAELNEK